MRSDPNRASTSAARHSALLAAGTLATVLLAGCGGGMWDWLSDSNRSDPTVSLAAAPNPVQAGQNLQLVAAATGDPEIDEVAFFSVGTDDALTRLGSVGSAPFTWTLTVANDATGTLRYQARVTDSGGRSVDSLVVSVPISTPP